MSKSKQLYDYPEYYETAFSWRDIKKEADFFDRCIQHFSKTPVRRVLELGSGPAPHMDQWAKRGIEYVGIDTNEKMIEYAKKRARRLTIVASILKSDMLSFSLEKPVDFVYVMLGSLYANTTKDLDSHFNSVAKALTPGGLYFLDWCVNFQWSDSTAEEQSWNITKEKLKAEVTFKTERVDRAAQTVRNTLTANIDDAGHQLKLEAIDIVRTIFPQEFLLQVEKSGQFEFLGWWNNWNLEEPVEKAARIRRPIVLLRKTLNRAGRPGDHRP